MKIGSIEVTEREGEEGVRSEPEEEEQQSQPQQITATISGPEKHTVILTQPPIATGQPLYYPPPPPQHVILLSFLCHVLAKFLLKLIFLNAFSIYLNTFSIYLNASSMF